MSVYTGRVDGTITIVAHETIAQAEAWIAKQERLDPEGVKSGAYYIDAPEGALTRGKHAIKPVTDVRPGDVAFLSGRPNAVVERIEKGDDGRYSLILDNGMTVGPMTDAYSVEVVVVEASA